MPNLIHAEVEVSTSTKPMFWPPLQFIDINTTWTFKSKSIADRLELECKSAQSMRKSLKIHARLANLDQTFRNQVAQEHLGIV